MARGASLAGALVLAACSGAAPASGGLPLDEATRLIAEHRQAFERFEPWAHRTAAADATFASRTALDEVAFSPIRRDESIVWARIDRDGGGDLQLVHPPGAALPGDLVYARPAGTEDIEVARAAVPDAAVVLRRAHSLEDGATITVTIAFRE